MGGLFLLVLNSNGASLVAGFTASCIGPIIAGARPGPIPGAIPIGPGPIIPGRAKGVARKVDGSSK